MHVHIDPNHLPFGYFDLVAFIMLMLGVRAGRKHGMSNELMVSLQWVAAIFACGYFYRPVGDWLETTAPVSHLFCYVTAYITLAILVKISFSLLKKGLGGKLVGSDLFGGGEFYLGMMMGAVRFACILLAAMALLNARAYTQQEVDAKAKYQNDWYGTNFFPELPGVQRAVFKESFTGKNVKKYAGFLLIAPTAPEVKELKRRNAELP